MRSRSATTRRMSRAVRARIGYFLGLLLLAAGLGWFVHPGLGVAVAGVGLIAWSVLLYDVDEVPQGPAEREDGPW
jgi:uncharacterized membrane protein YczE